MQRAGLISNVRSYLARLFAYVVLLVFAAVTLAWWGANDSEQSALHDFL